MKQRWRRGRTRNCLLVRCVPPLRCCCSLYLMSALAILRVAVPEPIHIACVFCSGRRGSPLAVTLGCACCSCRISRATRGRVGRRVAGRRQARELCRVAAVAAGHVAANHALSKVADAEKVAKAAAAAAAATRADPAGVHAPWHRNQTIRTMHKRRQRSEFRFKEPAEETKGVLLGGGGVRKLSAIGCDTWPLCPRPRPRGLPGGGPDSLAAAVLVGTWVPARWDSSGHCTSNNPRLRTPAENKRIKFSKRGKCPASSAGAPNVDYADLKQYPIPTRMGARHAQSETGCHIIYAIGTSGGSHEPAAYEPVMANSMQPSSGSALPTRPQGCVSPPP